MKNALQLSQAMAAMAKEHNNEVMQKKIEMQI
jgi:hypothetical protein